MKQLKNDTRTGRMQLHSLQAAGRWGRERWSRWALVLQQKAGRYSARTQKVGVLLMGGLSLVVSTLVLVKGYTTGGLPPRTPVMQVLPLSPSGHPSGGRAREDPRIRRLRFSLERLYTTEAGRRLRDSLCHERPGLSDTLQWLRHYYLPTHKNK